MSLNSTIWKKINTTCCETQKFKNNIIKYVQDYISPSPFVIDYIYNTNTISNTEFISYIFYNPKPNFFPSQLEISGLTGIITNIELTLYNITSNFETNLQILLESSSSNKTNALLLSNDNSTEFYSNINLTFSDLATTSVTNASKPLQTGTYKLTTNTEFNVCDFSPYGSSLSVFNNETPNGIWRLWIYNQAYNNINLEWSINGWSIKITTKTLTYDGVITDTKILVNKSNKIYLVPITEYII